MGNEVSQSYKVLLSHRKNFLKRPMVLFTVIIFTVITLMMYFQMLLPQMSALPEISQLISKFLNGNIAVNLFNTLLPSCIFMTIVMLVLWYIYIQSARKNPRSSPKAGLAVFYIFSLIEVIISVIAFILIIGAVVFIAVGGVEIAKEIIPEVNSIGNAVAVVLVLAVIFAVIILLYPISQLRFFASLKGKEYDEKLSVKGCVIYPLLNLFLAVFSVSGILASAFVIPNVFGISMPFGTYTVSFCAFLALIILFRFMLCIIPFSYRSYAKRVNRMIF